MHTLLQDLSTESAFSASSKPEANHQLSGNASLASNTLSDMQGRPMLQQTAAGLSDPLLSSTSVSSLEGQHLDSKAGHCLDSVQDDRKAATGFTSAESEQSLVAIQNSTLLDLEPLLDNPDQDLHGDTNPFPEPWRRIQPHKCTGAVTQQQLDCWTDPADRLLMQMLPLPRHIIVKQCAGNCAQRLWMPLFRP